MALQDYEVGATVPVRDMAKSREFYEGKLGLADGIEEGDGGLTYICGGGSRIHIFAAPDAAGSSSSTVAGFRADDVEGTVDELSANGVAFERYDDGPFETDEKGVADLQGTKVAWFKDPDGNLLAIASN